MKRKEKKKPSIQGEKANKIQLKPMPIIWPIGNPKFIRRTYTANNVSAT